MNRLALNLKLIRKERWRISQDRFGHLMDSTRSKINSYENGGVEPSIAFILKLQSYTKLSVKEIFYDELSPEQIPPYPLEEGQYFTGEPIPKPIEKSEIQSLLKSHSAIEELLNEMHMRIKAIENTVRSK